MIPKMKVGEVRGGGISERFEKREKHKFFGDMLDIVVDVLM